ncbi:MAG: hypothetical protein QHJ34_05580 [bacterium]|jgi:hypothetical protein|nr:hypothetical protein [candidate division KSB1 bacterium]MDH7559689.1 hypothetical protein [bacterium]
MPIVVVKRGRAAKKILPTAVGKEEELQRYIRENPGAIPLDDIREDMQPCVLAREFTTSSGAIDALAIDEEGAAYIIETKLYKNPDKRFVVAQVLDYGAALWKAFQDSADIDEMLEGAVSEVSGVSLRAKVADAFGFDYDKVDEVLDRFKSDLSSGRFTFIFLMDHVHDQLKHLVSFINANSRFRLLACELEFYRDEDFDILVPKLYGAETIKNPPSSLAPR